MATSLLYPRLPPAIAHRLFEHEKSQSVVTLQGAPEHPDAVFSALGGVEITRQELQALGDAIRSRARVAGFPETLRDEARRDVFDLASANILHHTMMMVPAEAAAIDVWAFIGTVLLPDICFWRFPNPPADRVIGPDLTRHTFARLWWRAYMLADLDGFAGLSALAAISESEMNQVFERRSIGGNRALIRATARKLLQLPPEQRRREPVRNAVRRLRRLLAFTMLECVTPEKLDGVIASIFDAPSNTVVGPIGGPTVPTEPEEREPPGQEPSDSPTEFDDMHIADVPMQIAQLISTNGGIAGADLARLYESSYGVRVSSAREELLKRLAWSAAGRHFIQRDEVNDLWLPGNVSPQPVAQMADWTIRRIRQRATDLLKEQPRKDPWEQIVGEVYRADGGRVPKVVMGIVGKLVNEVKRELRSS
jgi:Family of unknown function (DUF6339)